MRMRFDTVIEEVSATPLYLLLIFVALLVAFDLILVRWRKIDDVAWKKVDYYYLGAAAVGILSLSGQAESVLAQRYATTVGRWADSQYSAFHNMLGEAASFGLCIPRERGPGSPDDFDAIVADQRRLCSQSIELAKVLPKALPPSVPTLESMGYKPLGPANHGQGFVEQVNLQAESYRHLQARHAEMTMALQEDGWKLVYKIIGPLFLALALALRITKVTGEIANARKKKDSAPACGCVFPTAIDAKPTDRA